MLMNLDNAQMGAVEIAIGKVPIALDFRRASKALQDAIPAGGAGLRLGMQCVGHWRVRAGMCRR
jgi:hypothetical protein